MKHFSIS